MVAATATLVTDGNVVPQGSVTQVWKLVKEMKEQQSHGIETLFRMMGPPNEEVSTASAAAFWHLAETRTDFHEVLIGSAYFFHLLLALDEGSSKKQQWAEKCVQLIFPDYTLGRAHGKCRRLATYLLQNGSPAAKEASAAALGILAALDPTQAAQMGPVAILGLVRALRRGSFNATETCIQGLQSVVRHAACQELVARAGGIPLLMKLLRNSHSSSRVREQAILTLEHLSYSL